MAGRFRNGCSRCRAKRCRWARDLSTPHCIAWSGPATSKRTGGRQTTTDERSTTSSRAPVESSWNPRASRGASWSPSLDRCWTWPRGGSHAWGYSLSFAFARSPEYGGAGAGRGAARTSRARDPKACGSRDVAVGSHTPCASGAGWSRAGEGTVQGRARDPLDRRVRQRSPLRVPAAAKEPGLYHDGRGLARTRHRREYSYFHAHRRGDAALAAGAVTE